MKDVCDAYGRGGWPPIYKWINPPSLGSNGIHYIEFPNQMRKLLLNLARGEPLPLVQEMHHFDNPINLEKNWQDKKCNCKDEICM
jgi:hypothetical protein